jgi:uncharacterized membrane protein SpoIIM required for sporulation
MSLPLALALIDAAAAIYLGWYCLRRQRRNRGPLAVTAVFLLVCAVALGVIGLLEHAWQPPTLPAVIPAGELA